MKKLCRKLKSRLAFSLTEMLLAVALLGIFLSITTIGVNASVAVYRRSIALADSQSLSSSIANALISELRYARNITPDPDPTVESFTFDSDVYGLGVSVSSAARTGGVERVYIVSSDGSRTYKLLEDKAYTAMLHAHTVVSYDPSTKLFTVTITVNSEDLEDADGRTTVVTVSPLNS